MNGKKGMRIYEKLLSECMSSICGIDVFTHGDIL